MNVTRQELFRPESLEARHAAWLGRHTLALGAPATSLSFVVTLLTALSVAMLLYGTYGRRVELHGVVLPTKGLMQAISPTAGRLESLNVHDGERVTNGTLLYVVNLDTTTAKGDTQQQVLDALANQRSVLVDQIALKLRFRAQQDIILQQRIDNLQDQIKQTGNQLAMKDEFVGRLTKSLSDYNRYLQTGIGNINERNNQQNVWMRAKDELEELRSVLLRLQGQLIEAQFQQSTTNLQIDNEIDGMRSKISDLDQQVANTEARRSIEVRAAGDGVVTAIASHPGQIVASGARVLTILPDQHAMQAELLAPSTSIGFVRPGQRVRLRYSAFPYQKFGQYWGTLTEVSHAALQPEELKALVPSMSPSDQGRTFYRVVVAPDRQDVNAYGRPEPLQASMQVDARVMLEDRPLYQWLLEPLYSLNEGRGA